MGGGRAGRRRRRRRAIVTLGSPVGLMTPTQYSPGGGNCRIRYSFEQADAEGEEAYLRLLDKDNTTVYEHDNLALLYLRAGAGPVFTDNWDGRDSEGTIVALERGPLTVKLKVGEHELSREIELVRGVQLTPDEDYKQYVNMDQGTVDSHEGRDIEISAQVSPPEEGRRVYFRIEPHDDNRDGLDEDEQASLSEEEVRTDENGVAQTTLTLSTYGGDRCRVAARLLRRGSVMARTGWFHVWRRLFYEITEMEGYSMSNDVINYVKAAMDKVFIQMDQATGKHTGREVEVFTSPGVASAWADETCTNRRVPLKVHYAVISYAGRKVEDDDGGVINTESATLSSRFRPWDFEDEDWVISAKYREEGGSTWHDFDVDRDISLTGDNPRKQIVVDFSETDVDPTETPQEVRIRYHRMSGINGWGGPRNLHVRIAKGTINEFYSRSGRTAAQNRADIDRIMAGTCIHEPGHAMNLVYGQDWQTSDASQGRHCQYEDCVMWYQGRRDRSHDYHSDHDPGCHTYLRGKDLSVSTMRSRWRFPRS